MTDESELCPRCHAVMTIGKYGNPICPVCGHKPFLIRNQFNKRFSNLYK